METKNHTTPPYLAFLYILSLISYFFHLDSFLLATKRLVCDLLLSTTNPTMRSLHWLAIAPFLVATIQAQENTSPFHWSQSQQFVSQYAKTGKMEQKGRTGVAAMHAVLLK